MRFAVIDGMVGAEPKTGAFVENIITLNPEQKEEMERMLGKPLLDVKPLGFEIGDLYNGNAWTRNVDGEQVTLPIEVVAEEPGVEADIEEILKILEGRG